MFYSQYVIFVDKSIGNLDSENSDTIVNIIRIQVKNYYRSIFIYFYDNNRNMCFLNIFNVIFSNIVLVKENLKV